MHDVFKLPVFPAADVFPMMAKDELAELAADIKANGQREAIVLAKIPDKDDPKRLFKLVDGRNRRAACKLAGVEPSFRFLDDDEDPTAYVISANIHRRHMTKGQRAMAELRSIAPCRVIGLVVPYNAAFESFLRSRFLGAVR